MSSDMKKALLVAVLTVVIFAVVLSGRLLQESVPRVATVASGSPRLAELLGDQGMDGFALAIEDREFGFPADHGPHPDFRNEWWYVTGNLDGEDGQRFGFELTIFRFSLKPGAAESTADGSAWRSNQVYIAHFAVTDAE